MAMKSRFLLAALAPLLFGSAAHAGALVDVQIVDRDTGSTLPLYTHRAKHYVAGAPGHRYAVRIVNRTGARVLTVLSVDGVNAVTGETASPEQSGYVLGPYESTEVAGWRKDMNAIAAFEFTALSDSYAASTGRPGNVGVIGVAVFRERPVPPPPPVYRDDEIALGSREEKSAADAAAPGAPSTSAGGAGTYPKSVTSTGAARSAAQNEAARRAPSPQPEESLGTGHGARESSHASYTTFVRDSTRPYEVVSIWYDSRKNLQARGIIERPMPKRGEPDPFPSGFVPDPPRH
jgi:hypothetical protein